MSVVCGFVKSKNSSEKAQMDYVIPEYEIDISIFKYSVSIHKTLIFSTLCTFHLLMSILFWCLTSFLPSKYRKIENSCHVSILAYKQLIAAYYSSRNTILQVFPMRVRTTF